MASRTLLRTAATAALLAAGSTSLLAQHFARNYEVPIDFEVRAVVGADDGTIALGGLNVIGSFLWGQAFSQRVDGAGNLLHQDQLTDDATPARLHDLLALGGGELLGCGTLEGSPWLVRLDADGQPTWQQISTDWIGMYESITEAPDGTFWVMGWMWGIPNTDLLVGHLDQNLQWIDQRTYRYPSVSFYHGSVVGLADGGAMVAAADQLADGLSDVFVARLDAAGDVMWSKVFGDGDDEGWERAPRLAVAANGDVLMSASQTGDGTDDEDFWVMRLDLQGQLVWEKTYDLGEDVAAGIVAMADGGMVVAGSSNANGTQNYAVLRLDANGAVVWARTLGGDQTEECATLSLLPDGDLLLGGLSKSFRTGATDPDAWIVRMGSDGSLTRGSPWIAPATFTVQDDVTPSSEVTGTTVPELFPGSTKARTLAWNPGQSVQAIENDGAWSDLGGGVAGVAGVPFLAGTGTLQANDYAAVVLSGARAGSVAFTVVGSGVMNAPAFGGTLVPLPDLILVRPTGSLGFDRLQLSWPAGLPSGLPIYLQAAVVDGGTMQGFALSNAVQCITP